MSTFLLSFCCFIGIQLHFLKTECVEFYLKNEDENEVYHCRFVHIISSSNIEKIWYW